MSDDLTAADEADRLRAWYWRLAREEAILPEVAATRVLAAAAGGRAAGMMPIDDLITAAVSGRHAIAERDQARSEVERLTAERDEARAMLAEVSKLSNSRAPNWETALGDINDLIDEHDGMNNAATATIDRLEAERDQARSEVERLRAMVPKPKKTVRPWRLQGGFRVWGSYATRQAAIDSAASQAGGQWWRSKVSWHIVNRLTGERIDLGPDGRPVEPKS